MFNLSVEAGNLAATINNSLLDQHKNVYLSEIYFRFLRDFITLPYCMSHSPQFQLMKLWTLRKNRALK